MVKRRIATKPTEVRDQLVMAAAGIGGEPDWPAAAPTQADVTTDTNDLHNAILAVENLKAQLAQARTTLHTECNKGIGTMKRIDQVTDGLYGPDSTKKENFGLPPKKTGGESVPLVQVVITKITDGTAPASLFIDWETQEGATAYQVEWFMNSTSGTPLGNAAVSNSEYEITGLQPKQQYWVHVRAIRGNEYGTWSDPATRVANL